MIKKKNLYERPHRRRRIVSRGKS